MSGVITSSIRQQIGGFTLLEVLVALAVVAIALGAALTTSYRNVNNLVTLRDSTFGRWLAMDKLSAWRLDLLENGSGSEIGGTETMGGVQLYWRLRPAITADADTLRAEVEVRSHGADGHLLALATGYRTAVKTPVQ